MHVDLLESPKMPRRTRSTPPQEVDHGRVRMPPLAVREVQGHPYCTDYGLHRKDNPDWKGYNFCAACDNYDNEIEKPSERGRSFRCTANHTDWSHPTELKRVDPDSSYLDRRKRSEANAAEDEQIIFGDSGDVAAYHYATPKPSKKPRTLTTEANTIRVLRAEVHRLELKCNEMKQQRDDMVRERDIAIKEITW